MVTQKRREPPVQVRLDIDEDPKLAADMHTEMKAAGKTYAGKHGRARFVRDAVRHYVDARRAAR